MSKITKVKSDMHGLYVNAGGYYAIPIDHTAFKEGDEVKTHHFGGSVRAGVGITDTNFRNDPYETWITRSLSMFEYVEARNKFPEEIFEEFIKLHREPYFNSKSWNRIKQIKKKYKFKYPD